MSISASTTKSATQQALGLPEIAALIVDVIDQDVHARNGWDNSGTLDDMMFWDKDEECLHRTRNPAGMLQLKRLALGALACVNHIWFALVVPRLWRHIYTMRDPFLTTLFQNISPKPRNIYAQYIESGSIEVIWEPESSQTGSGGHSDEVSTNILSEIEFPRLSLLSLTPLPPFSTTLPEEVYFGRPSTMSSSDDLSAAQKVFGIPELVALIVDFIYQDATTTKPKQGNIGIFRRTKNVDIPGVPLEKRRGALAPLACLNRLWFQSIVPVLWRHPTQTNTDPCLTALFWNIHPERRSMYAQYVESGTLVFAGDPVPPYGTLRTKYEEEREWILAAVAFPRLKALHLKACLGRRPPQLGPHRVEHIVFDPRERHIQPGWLRMDLVQFEAMFKDLKRLQFYHWAHLRNPVLAHVVREFEKWITEKRRSELGNDTPFKIDRPVLDDDHMFLLTLYHGSFGGTMPAWGRH
ncbi:hypothetical protein PG984_016563 [Apiospora sp. TS-2023a]